MTTKNAPKTLKRVLPCVIALGCTALAVLTPFAGLKQANADFSPATGTSPFPAELSKDFFSFYNVRMVDGKNTEYGADVDIYDDFLIPAPIVGDESSTNRVDYSCSFGTYAEYYASDNKRVTLDTRYVSLNYTAETGGYALTSLMLKQPLYVNEDLYNFIVGRVSNSPVRVRCTTGGSGLTSFYPNAVATMRCNIAFTAFNDDMEAYTKFLRLSDVSLPLDGSYYNVSGYLPTWSQVEQYAVDGYLYLDTLYLEFSCRNLKSQTNVLQPVTITLMHNTVYSEVPNFPTDDINEIQRAGSISYAYKNIKLVPVDDVGQKALWGGVFAFLETEIFPNFKLAYMLYIAIAFAIVMFFIKYALGG